MTRKQKIILSITGIILVTLILVGLTYGYYLTTIKGNTNTKSITTSLAKLELKYDDGNGLISKENMIPGDKIVKTFSVENTGNKKVVNYTVYLENVINEFIDKNDLKITLKCTSNNGTCNGNTLTYPSSDGIIAVNDIEEKEIQTFELKVDFIETNDLQNDNMNKKFEGNVKIIDIKSTNKKLVTSEGENNATVSSPELLTNFKVYGNSLQETRSGKNLINIPDFNVSYTNTYYINTATNFKLEAGKTYTLSFDYNIKSATSTVAVAVGYGTTTYSKDIQAKKDYDTQTTGRQSVTFTTPSAYTTDDYLFVRFARVSTPSTVNVDLSNIQLEEGTTATDYEAYGVSPSPTYPSEISSVGDLVTDSSDTNYGKYKIELKTTGKNLMDMDKMLSYSNDVIKNDNEYTFTTNPKMYTNGIKINLKKGTKITSSGKVTNVTGNNFRVDAVFKNGKAQMITGYSKTDLNTEVDIGKMITLNDDVEYIRFNWTTDGKYIIKDFQIEIGDTATDYETYHEKITNIYLDEPLRKIGNYSDYVDLINKKVVRNIKLLELSENDNFVTTGISGSNYQGFALNSAQYNALKSDLEVYSNRFQYATEKKIIINSCSQTNATYGLRFAVSTDIVSNKSVNELKEYLKNNKTYIIYTLSASTEDAIEIPSIELTENIKHIFIESNIKPSNIEIGYIN